jgi:hypothetical protein
MAVCSGVRFVQWAAGGESDAPNWRRSLTRAAFTTATTIVLHSLDSWRSGLVSYFITLCDSIWLAGKSLLWYSQSNQSIHAHTTHLLQ